MRSGTLDMASGWEVPAGYPAGIKQKVISGALDEENRRGSRTRLLKFDPGVYTKSPFEHEYWEEVYLVSGDLTVQMRREYAVYKLCALTTRSKGRRYRGALERGRYPATMEK